MYFYGLEVGVVHGHNMNSEQSYHHNLVIFTLKNDHVTHCWAMRKKCVYQYVTYWFVTVGLFSSWLAHFKVGQPISKLINHVKIMMRCEACRQTKLVLLTQIKACTEPDTQPLQKVFSMPCHASSMLSRCGTAENWNLQSIETSCWSYLAMLS